MHAHVVVGQDLPGHARVPSPAWVFRRMLSVKVVPSLARSRKRFMNGLRWPWGSSINDIHFEGVAPKACNSTDKWQWQEGYVIYASPLGGPAPLASVIKATFFSCCVLSISPFSPPRSAFCRTATFAEKYRIPPRSGDFTFSPSGDSFCPSVAFGSAVKLMKAKRQMACPQGLSLSWISNFLCCVPLN